MADEARQQMVGAGERAQEARMNGVLQAHRGARTVAIKAREALRRQLHERGAVPHAGRSGMRHILEHGEVADELARTGDGDASLPAAAARQDFDRPAYDEEARARRLASGEEPARACELERPAEADDLVDLARLEAVEETQQRQECAP